jgi:hypothetical protein
MSKILFRCAILAVLAMAFAVAPASAGTPFVDVDSLQPPPPPGATCMSVGADTVRCDTFKDIDLDHEPVFDLACGTIYETSADHRDGIRWYHGGLLVKRHVDEDGSGFWSASPTASSGPVRLAAAWTSTSSWTIPGDDSTLQERFQGLGLRVDGPDGPIVRLAGQDALDGMHHGVQHGLTDVLTPEAYAKLSAALCG